MWLPAPDESTWIGLLRLSLYAPGARSLKDKRKGLSGLKDRVRARFGLGVAEVGHLEDRSRAVVAVVAVGNEARALRSLLDKVRHDIEQASVLIVEAAHLDIHRPMDHAEPDDLDDWEHEAATRPPRGYDPGHG